MSDQSIDRLLGTLLNKVENLGDQFGGMREDMKESERASAASRDKVHKRLDDVTLRQAHLETSVATMNGRVEALSGEVRDMKDVTDGVTKLTHQAEGLGTLGHALLRVGGWVLASAGWFVGVYTYWTGRPPP
ncbi:DUF1515 family protein [Hoeflea sp. YIM 152468]|uniref:DUF1515 family protein n=1 Tax=Hoeflea sp. YIM 152468 TaxID=3031759 RepID=UPI0023D9F255|nr:DUF1515 family protein [Hoeflea sp. YIM 152468]MDF1606941.1 DUF1515 family protein [Hoeflea sp. YIM 152468]